MMISARAPTSPSASRTLSNTIAIRESATGDGSPGVQVRSLASGCFHVVEGVTNPLLVVAPLFAPKFPAARQLFCTKYWPFWPPTY
jgi:hypothetical protein